MIFTLTRNFDLGNNWPAGSGKFDGIGKDDKSAGYFEIKLSNDPWSAGQGRDVEPSKAFSILIFPNGDDDGFGCVLQIEEVEKLISLLQDGIKFCQLYQNWDRL